MALPAPQELLDRLRDVYGATTDADLARHLGVGERYISRWKSGEGMRYGTTVRLLDEAGWLSTSEGEPASVRQLRASSSSQTEKPVKTGFGACFCAIPTADSSRRPSRIQHAAM